MYDTPVVPSVARSHISRHLRLLATRAGENGRLAIFALSLAATLPVAAQVTGKAAGLTLAGSSCSNLTTGQKVVSTTDETAWDCSALGLQFDLGDQVEVGTRGLLPAGEATGPLQAASVPRDFVTHFLKDIFELENGVAIAGDLDGDGDADVSVSNHFLWLENLGGSDPEFDIHLLNSPIDMASAHALADIDMDQRLDIVAGFSVGGEVSWYRNEGGSPPTFTSQLIDQRQGGWRAHAVDAVDVDGDGDTDFFALMNTASCCAEEVVWLEDVGGGYVRHLIEQDDPGIGSWIFVFDADGDEDPDLLYSDFVDETLSWFENEAGAFTQKHVLAVGLFARRGTGHADFDADGDQDLIGYESLAGELQWFENLGDGSFAASGIAIVPGHFLHGVVVADFSSDGRPDILIGDDQRALTWFENLGGSPTTFEQHAVIVEKRAITPAAGDIDGDGRPDVVAVEHQRFAWHENRIGLRLSVTGLDVTSYLCRNRTTGRTVRRQSVESEIDCEAQGLRVSPGDEISVFANGQVQ